MHESWLPFIVQCVVLVQTQGIIRHMIAQEYYSIRLQTHPSTIIHVYSEEKNVLYESTKHTVDLVNIKSSKY